MALLGHNELNIKKCCIVFSSYRFPAIHHGHHRHHHHHHHPAPWPSHHHHKSHLALGVKRLREKPFHHVAYERPHGRVVYNNVKISTEPTSRPCASGDATVEISTGQRGRQPYQMIPYGLPYGAPLDKYYRAPRLEQKRRGDSRKRPHTYLCLAAVAFVINPPVG